jgi:hypothetical protein
MVLHCRSGMFTFNMMGFTGLASGLLGGVSISAFIIGFALKEYR